MLWNEILDKEGDNRAITLTVNQQYVLMNMALLMLRAPSLFISDVDETNTEEVNDWIDALIYAVMNEEIPVPVLGATSELNLWVHEASVISGNALAVSALTTQFHNVIGLQNAPTINSKVRWTRFLSAGDWSFSYLYRRLTNGGVIDIYVTPDGGSTVTILNNHDTRGTTLDNQFVRGTFTLPVSGLCQIEIEVVATSLGSNYGNTFTLLQLWRNT